jgi:hypothetical protein
MYDQGFVRESGGYGWRADELHEEVVAVRFLLQQALKEKALLEAENRKLKAQNEKMKKKVARG